MKHLFRLTALMVVVLTLAACDKNKEDVRHERDIVYTVDQNTTTVHLTTEAEFDALLDQFCDYAESGAKVSFYNANSVSTGTKNATHFSTTNREEMKAWMRQMEDAGMTVTVTYDHNTGTYNGTAYATAPQPQSDYWVDLGLPSGLLWAKCNVGAINPEDTGYFFAWGETWPKEDYSWSTYSLCNNGDRYSLTKYSAFEHVGYNGYTDTLTILEPCDDAATVNIGNGARTPTYNEWQELKDNCTAVWTTRNGINGLLIIGPNGNSIFLPDVAHRAYTSISIWAFYWSATIAVNISCYDDMPTSACSFEVDDVGLKFFRSERYIGMSVRAVCSSN